MTYRGLGFGVPRSLKENVRIEFKNDEEGNQFTTIIWRDNYDVKENEDSVNGGIKDSKGGIYIDLGGLNDLSERQKLISSTIQKDVQITTKSIADTLDIPQRTIEREISDKLKSMFGKKVFSKKSAICHKRYLSY